MNAPKGDPTKNMMVKALLNDEASETVVKFDLQLSQQGPPFIVWGTGVDQPGGTGSNLTDFNYYYSLTNLQASGSISIDDEKFQVTGVTWMDHEYGKFGTSEAPVKWILQDMLLDNGVSISNFSLDPPKLNQRTKSKATVQRTDGTRYFVDSFVTPIGKTWTSPKSKKEFFMQLLVEIPAFEATFDVSSLVEAQEFPLEKYSVYEGVATVSGTFEGKKVAGTAWNEQTAR